jgi:hypothetical protein
MVKGAHLFLFLQLGIQRDVSVGGMPDVLKTLLMVVGSWAGLAMLSNCKVQYFVSSDHNQL